jgi:predicted DNA-binding transcriptional regulator AlpA
VILLDKRLLSVADAAKYLSISPRTLYNGIAPKSKVPFPVKPKRIGKLVRFDIRDLDRYVDSLDSASTKFSKQDTKPIESTKVI